MTIKRNRGLAIFAKGSPFRIDDPHGFYMQCSQCKCQFAVYGEETNPDPRVHFCPCCGAQRLEINTRKDE